MSFAWDLDADGAFDDATGAEPAQIPSGARQIPIPSPVNFERCPSQFVNFERCRSISSNFERCCSNFERCCSNFERCRAPSESGWPGCPRVVR